MQASTDDLGARAGRQTRRLLGSVAIAVVSAACGAAMLALVAPFGDLAPLLLLALPIALFLIVGVVIEPLVGIIAVFLSFAVGAIEVPSGLQASEAAVVVVGTLVALRRLGRGQTPLPWAPSLTWLVALFAWSLIALSSALDRELALKQIASLVGGILFVCIVMAAVRTFDDLRVILSGLIATATVISLAALAGGAQLQSSFGGSAVSGRLQGVFDQPNQLGAFCALTGVLAAGMVFASKTRKGRILTVSAMVLIVLALLLSLSRGGWVGTALGALTLFFGLREARRTILIASIPLLIAGVLLGSFAPDSPQIRVVGERFSALTVRSPYDQRSAIYTEAVREIRADPWTGQGPGNFPVASLTAGSGANTVGALHAHNLWLTWAAEAGVPAVAFLVGFMVSLAVAVRRATRAALASGDRHNRALIVGIAAALMAVVGQGTVDYTLRNAVIFLVVMGVVGALLAAVSLYKSAEPVRSPAPERSPAWAETPEPA